MDFILTNKWLLLIGAELLFWICAIAFLIFRYWYRFNRLTLWIVILFIVNDLWIAFLAFADYQRSGILSLYQLVIIIVLVYAMTYGKSDFKKLDVFLQTRIATYKGESFTAPLPSKPAYGLAYAHIEWRQFIGHLTIFVCVHITFYITFGLSDQLPNLSTTNWLSSLFDTETSIWPFTNTHVNSFSRAWFLVIAIDFIITLSYTVFPKKRPQP